MAVSPAYRSNPSLGMSGASLPNCLSPPGPLCSRGLGCRRMMEGSRRFDSPLAWHGDDPKGTKTRELARKGQHYGLTPASTCVAPAF